MTSQRRRLVPFLAGLALLIALIPAARAEQVALPQAAAEQISFAAGPTKCKGGQAAGFPCKNIDLVGHVPANALTGSPGTSDIWGWVDPETKDEYAILGSSNGVHFVNVTKPSEPLYLGMLVGKPAAGLWQEIEILNNTAYIVCDLTPCGLQVFDLTRLSGAEAALPLWRPDVVIPMPIAHSIDSNPETNHIFINGSALSHGSFIFDVSVPLAPVPVGSIHEDGYTHDTLCRNYKGPDKDYKGNEICFSFNEDTVTIYDVTANPQTPVQLARATYENASYTHSGALTKDHKILITTDESDEQDHNIPGTLYIWDVSKLTAPKLIGTYVSRSRAIDHNIFSEGRALWHANYVNGFQVLDLKNAHKGKLKEVAYFDTMPQSDLPDYSGAWAAYPYLPSGNVIVGNMGGGFFIVRPHDKVFKSLGVKLGGSRPAMSSL